MSEDEETKQRARPTYHHTRSLSGGSAPLRGPGRYVHRRTASSSISTTWTTFEFTESEREEIHQKALELDSETLRALEKMTQSQRPQTTDAPLVTSDSLPCTTRMKDSQTENTSDTSLTDSEKDSAEDSQNTSESGSDEDLHPKRTVSVNSKKSTPQKGRKHGHTDPFWVIQKLERELAGKTSVIQQLRGDLNRVRAAEKELRRQKSVAAKTKNRLKATSKSQDRKSGFTQRGKYMRRSKSAKELESFDQEDLDVEQRVRFDEQNLRSSKLVMLRGSAERSNSLDDGGDSTEDYYRSVVWKAQRMRRSQSGGSLEQAGEPDHYKIRNHQNDGQEEDDEYSDSVTRKVQDNAFSGIEDDEREVSSDARESQADHVRRTSSASLDNSGKSRRRSSDSSTPKTSPLNNSSKKSPSTPSRSAHENMVHFLVGGGDIDALEHGSARLHNACRFGDAEAVKYLLEMGANIDLVDANNETPIMVSLGEGHIGIASLLLENNADLTITNQNTALHSAIIHWNGADIDQLCALVEKMLEMERAYLIDYLNANRNTPLMLAIHYALIPIVEILIRHGADVNLHGNVTRHSPLMLACSDIRVTKVVELLLEENADIHYVGANGSTALHVAARASNLKAVQMLLERGANTRASDDNGQTPRDVAHNAAARKMMEKYDPSSKYSTIKINADDVLVDTASQPIASGMFSDVYKGSLFGTPVAVKILRLQSAETASVVLENFKLEVGLMCDISHPNISCLLGATVLDGKFCIITELLELGSLRNLLSNAPTKYLQRTLVKRLAVSLGRGLAWLHNQVPVIIHKDLHSRNVLIAADKTCKICDLGLSEIYSDYEWSSPGAGSVSVPSSSQTVLRAQNVRYARIQPPDDVYSQASDVFMYGLIVIEILLPKDPLPDGAAVNRLQTSDFEGLDPKESFEARVIRIAKQCCEFESARRPEILEVLSEWSCTHSRPNDASETDPCFVGTKRVVHAETLSTSQATARTDLETTSRSTSAWRGKSAFTAHLVPNQ